MLRKLFFAGLALAAIPCAIVADAYFAEADAAGWTGCYVGGAAGYSHALTDTTLSDGVDTLGIDSLGAGGAVLTGLAGCDVQAARTVWGLWGSYSYHPDTTFSVTFTGAPTLLESSLENSWAVGGRAGYLITNSTLAYVLVGYSQAEVSDITSPLGGGFALSVPDLSGYVVGGGMETHLGAGWFLQAQGTFTDYQNESIDLTDVGLTDVALGLDTEVLEARVALTYRFNWSPVQSIPGFESKPLK